MTVECREIVDSLKKPESCEECQNLQQLLSENPGGKPMKSKGLIIAAIIGGSAVALSAICLPFVTPALRRVCLPFVPATPTQLQNIQKALTIYGKGKGSRLVDIGSGDGRIVHMTAQQGYLAHGIELNPWLVMYSKYKSLTLGLNSVATFSRQDLWKAHFAPYDNIVIFGVEQMMADLEKKLGREMKADATVIACRFQFPNWTQVDTIGEGIDSVWVYQKSV